MKRLAGALLLIAALAGGAVAYLWWRPPGPQVEVSIPQRASAAETAAILAEHRVVPSARVFRVAARLTGADRRLRPGTFRLHRNMGLGRALKELTEGVPLGLRVVIPEGFSTWQIAERLEAAGIVSGGEMKKYLAANRLEGYLFPTTYFFEPGTSVERVVAKMREEFVKHIEAEYNAAEPKPRFTLHQVVTLASIVEREAVVKQERPMIAAVYLNRMRKRMRLEADPTVQYAMGFWKKGLTYADLRTPSPYNTYLHFGLPPGPICSPGLESVRAVLRPAETDAIYFVADHTGGHVFSRTHEEHLRAVEAYRKTRREIRERLRREAARK